MEPHRAVAHIQAIGGRAARWADARRRRPGAHAQAACWGLAALLLAAVVCVPLFSAASDMPDLLGLHGPREIWAASCAACHGSNGQGTAQYIAGFEQPDSFPQFNECDQSADEYTRDYTEIIRDGGPARGFSQIMPAFGSVLTTEQINGLVGYIRSLCTDHDTSWPPGELNPPRALITDKAFPENEWILTTAINAQPHRAAGIANEIESENMVGSTNEVDLSAPIDWVAQPGGGLYGGIGDVTTGFSHVFYQHLGNNLPLYKNTGSILAVQGQITWATGDAAKGLGAGETQLGAYAMYDVILPGQLFLQLQPGGELPLHTYNLPRSVFLNTAFGGTFYQGPRYQGMGFGRQWSPMVEVTANRSMASGAVTDWDVMPEFQVSLNRRQNVRVDLGYLIPVNDTTDRPRQIWFYFEWDWGDGGLFEGW